MKLRNILALLLALCMVFALVACGETESKDTNDDEEVVNEAGEDKTGDNEEKEPEEDEEEIESEDTKPQVGDYIVHVKDENGDPIGGVKLLFAKETGDTTITTNEDGQAELVTYVTDITVTVKEVPEGFEMDDEEYKFDDDFELSITLKAE